MLKLIRKIYARSMVEIDLLIWWFRTLPLRSKSSPPQTKSVLVCDLMAMYAAAKVEAMLVSALASRGYRAVVFLPSRSRSIERIYSACGRVEFVYFDQLMDRKARDAGVAKADQLLSSDLSISELADLEVDGFRIGRNVLSRVVRRFRVGRIDPANAGHLEELRCVMGESLAIAEISKSLLQRLQPNLAIFLEKGYTPAGEVYDACLLRGVDTIQWLSAPQADRLLFKRYTLPTRSDHPFALGADTWIQLQSANWSEVQDQMVAEKIASHYESGAWYNRQQLQTGKRIMSPEEVRARLGVKTGRKLAVIFAHILYDATFFYGNNLYPDYEQWLVETVRAAIQNTELDWVIKVHPVNVWRSRMDGMPMEQIEANVLRNEFGELPPHVKLLSADTEINTYALYQAIDYGLTVRGTVGMELPCFGVPVITAGSGRYSEHGFTIDPTTREAYCELISRLHEVPRLDAARVRVARQYAYGAFFLRPYTMRVFQLNYHAPDFGVGALMPAVKLDARLMATWPESDDIAQFVAWAIDSRRSDLLAVLPEEFKIEV